MASDVAFIHDINRCLKGGKPFMLMESTPSMTNWQPVLALGGAKVKTDLDALRHAKRTVQEGASGVIYGRNVFQTENPEKFLDALIKVVKEGQEPEEMI